MQILKCWNSVKTFLGLVKTVEKPLLDGRGGGKNGYHVVW